MSSPPLLIQASSEANTAVARLCAAMSTIRERSEVGAEFMDEALNLRRPDRASVDVAGDDVLVEVARPDGSASRTIRKSKGNASTALRTDAVMGSPCGRSQRASKPLEPMS